MDFRILYLFLLSVVCGKIFSKIENSYDYKAPYLNKQTYQNQPKWLENVINSIKQDLKIYQIMIIEIDTNDNSAMFRQFQKNLLILYTNASWIQDKLDLLKGIKSLKSPRDTTLFLIIENHKNSTLQMQQVMSSIRQLAPTMIRPRCLFLRFMNSNQTYSKFLQNVWNDSFLDVTILEVHKTKGNSYKNARSSYKKVMIHYLNPFITNGKKKYSRKSPLFPEKLRNMNGYPMKIGIFQRTPLIQVERNLTKHPINAFGIDYFIDNMFSKVMNYRQMFLPSEKEGFGYFSCDKKKMTGFLRDLAYNKIHFIGVTTPVTKSTCKQELHENSIFRLDHYIAIVPVSKSSDFSMWMGKTFSCSILLTILIALTSWIIKNLFRFDERIWNLPLTLQILFGVSVRQQPSELKERIIFGCFLVIGFYYSSNMFASLTDFNFYFEEETEINSLRDLVGSGLQLHAEPNVISYLIEKFDNDDTTAWLRDGKETTDHEGCIKFLLDNKNISCVMRLTLAEWHAGYYRHNNLVKFVPEYLSSMGYGFLLGSGSPYVEKFNKILRSIIEFGLAGKWEIRKVLDSYANEKVENDRLEAEGMEKLKIRRLMIGIILVGNLVSVFVFLAELLVTRIQL